MIAILAEWRKAHEILEEVRAAVERYRGPVPQKIEVGIMMHIPATALRPTRFATEVDFIFVGTNDLTQNAFAAGVGQRALREVGGCVSACYLTSDPDGWGGRAPARKVADTAK